MKKLSEKQKLKNLIKKLKKQIKLLKLNSINSNNIYYDSSDSRCGLSSGSKWDNFG